MVRIDPGTPPAIDGHDFDYLTFALKGARHCIAREERRGVVRCLDWVERYVATPAAAQQGQADKTAAIILLSFELPRTQQHATRATATGDPQGLPPKSGLPQLRIFLPGRATSGDPESRQPRWRSGAANVQQFSPEIAIGYVVLIDEAEDSRRQPEAVMPTCRLQQSLIPEWSLANRDAIKIRSEMVDPCASAE
jgi:hypothetical protein